jgi:hypothetical protein
MKRGRQGCSDWIKDNKTFCFVSELGHPDPGAHFLVANRKLVVRSLMVMILPLSLMVPNISALVVLKDAHPAWAWATSFLMPVRRPCPSGEGACHHQEVV